MPGPSTIRVGNAGGYWGDDPQALYRQLSRGPVDYVTMDFLAEVTMSILQKQRSRQPHMGYAKDFLDQMHTCLPLAKETGTRIITNAGGLNPRGCGEGLLEIARNLNTKIRIATVEGDDLMGTLDRLRHVGVSLRNIETHEPFETIQDRVQSANGYLGAEPLVKALQEGAQIVITGRVADAALAVAPPVFEFEWSFRDWDRLAAAFVAGHILECGAQATGGNLTDWRQVPSFLDMGYPIAEFSADASFAVTKHENSGGLVNRKTVTSQLVYEIENPQCYMTPDVIADFSSIALQEEGADRVRVSGVKGTPPSGQFKVSLSYHDGYMAHGTIIVGRPHAVEKAHAMAEMFWTRLGIEFQETSSQLVGHSACHLHLGGASDPPEIMLRLGARDSDRGKLEEFSKTVPSLILNSVPGVAIVGSRPRIQEVMAYWPCLVPASEVTPKVTLLESGRCFQIPFEPIDSRTAASTPPSSQVPTVGANPLPEEGPAGRTMVEVPLLEVCYARSGDKGDTCNIGIVARSEKIYPWIRRELTAARVADHFAEICQGPVERFEIFNLLALNFVLRHCLGGGGTTSLRIDPQGKTLADALLLMKIELPEDLV